MKKNLPGIGLFLRATALITAALITKLDTWERRDFPSSLSSPCSKFSGIKSFKEMRFNLCLSFNSTNLRSREPLTLESESTNRTNDQK